MPDWLARSIVAESSVTWEMLAVRLAVAAGFGLLVAAIYRGTRDTSRAAHSFPGTLVLLCVLIAMVTQVIGTNVALAFSLVGALSIVRFRTAVQDTRDTAFVIFAVACGMAIGAGQPAVAALGTVPIAAVAWLFRDPPRRQGRSATRPYELEIRTDFSPDAEASVRRIITTHDSTAEVVAGRTSKQGTAMTLTYRLRLPRDVSLPALITELKGIGPVQSVELQQPRSDG